MDTSSVNLPDEIIELILSKCPAKSAIRFESVSKSWLSIIADPRFLRSLQSRLSENHEHKFFFIYGGAQKREACFMVVKDGKCRREPVLGYPLITPDHEGQYSPTCSCNGLILLLAPNYKTYALWNPLIRKHIVIPPPPPVFDTIANLQLHLYYDSVTEDYKIVHLREEWYVVYSCRTGSWGYRKYFASNLKWMMAFGAFVDGCRYTRHIGGVICFDVRDGKLHNLPEPREVDGLFQLRLAEVSGRLCLYGFSDGVGLRRLQLWVMEKNKCWRKLISMEKEDPLIQNLHPLCFTNQDDVVLRATVTRTQNGGHYDKHLIYNSNRKYCCNFQELAWDYYSIQCFSYEENLLMPTSTSDTLC